ncbi:unnamed protein product [Zymoseptoria tritici ST99CH_3D1]|nr:unnamed protein product [Zymoseptoria tritici ST99CH_3D1]
MVDNSTLISLPSAHDLRRFKVTGEQPPMAIQGNDHILVFDYLAGLELPKETVRRILFDTYHFTPEVVNGLFELVTLIMEASPGTSDLRAATAVAPSLAVTTTPADFAGYSTTHKYTAEELAH